MQGKDGYPSMTLLYLHAMDRLWQICKDCLFLIEGALRSHACNHMLCCQPHATAVVLCCMHQRCSQCGCQALQIPAQMLFTATHCYLVDGNCRHRPEWAIGNLVIPCSVLHKERMCHVGFPT